MDEEQLREALRELKVDDVLLQTVVTLINLGGRRLTVPEEKDKEQAHKAIEAVRALLPLCPEEEAAPIKDALSQLQMLYVKETDERAKARVEDLDAGRQDPNADDRVFGGSGFYRFLDDVEEVAVDTPYGPPSARIRLGEMDGVQVAFMPRHGDDHSLPPHRINYRANVWAMRQVGVRRIVGPSACGSLKPELAPGHVRGLRPVRGPHEPLARTPSTTGPRPPTCPPRTPTAATWARSCVESAREEGIEAVDGGHGGGDPGAALLHPGRVALVRGERLGRGQHDPVPRMLARPRARASATRTCRSSPTTTRVWRPCRTSSRCPRTRPSRFSARTSIDCARSCSGRCRRSGLSRTTPALRRWKTRSFTTSKRRRPPD